MFTIASTLLFICHITVQVTQKTRNSISVCPKYDLLILQLSLFALSCFSTSSSLSKLSYQSTLVINNSSSMYSIMNYIPQKISIILSYKMSRELHPPIDKCLYLYFTYGRIIVHKLLASFLRHI